MEERGAGEPVFERRYEGHATDHPQKPFAIPKKIDKAMGMPHTEAIPTRSEQIACREDP
jgi:hypothetical protein